MVEYYLFYTSIEIYNDKNRIADFFMCIVGEEIDIREFVSLFR